MIWHDHSRDFTNSGHALFPPSQPSWIRDKGPDDVFRRYMGSKAATIGTVVHEEAKECIDTKTQYTKREAVKVLTKRLVLNNVSRSAFDPDFLAGNFINFVNDAIGYNLRPEQKIAYSEWNWGTSDAIGFDERKKILRVHDLKTGIHPCKFEQLEVYASLFFLEYGNELGINPGNVTTELRIFQGGEVLEEFPTAEVIVPIMDSIIWHTNETKKIEEG